jgi:hypothetical protein
VRLDRHAWQLSGGGVRDRVRHRWAHGFGIRAHERCENRFLDNGGRRRLYDRLDCLGPTSDLDPHVVATACRSHDEALAGVARHVELVLDRADLLEHLRLLHRQHLRQHADERVGREHSR